jgi:hypothetical protein
MFRRMTAFVGEWRLGRRSSSRRGPRRTCMALAACAAVGAGAALLPAAASAQRSPSARELTLDVRPWSAELGGAVRVAGPYLLGFSFGVGGEELLSRTLTPDVRAERDLMPLQQVIRLGPFVRYRAAPYIDVDVGARLALATIYTHGDTPQLLAAVHAGVFVGGRYLRAGPRLVVGRIDAGLDRHTVVHLDYITLRGRLGF